MSKDRLDTSEDYDQHIAEHLEEVENMDKESLTNEHDLSVKEHLMEHVNPQREDETVEESDYEGMIKEQLIAFHIVP